LGFKCEWLSITSIRNEGNVGYTREVAHIPNAFKVLGGNPVLKSLRDLDDV